MPAPPSPSPCFPPVLYRYPRIYPSLFNREIVSSHLVHNTDVPVGLGGEAATLPTNRALILDAAVGAAAFKGIVLLLRTVGPRKEQSDVEPRVPTKSPGLRSFHEIALAISGRLTVL
jgi:hypothetical protein